MLAYLDLAMPEGRIVSGWFLDKLGSLKLAPAELIPRIAHACVIAQACGDKERENCGITIGETNVKSLTTSCKADALKGEKIIENAYSMLENTEMSGTNEEVKAIGEFQHELILFIFDLSDKYESLDGVMESFVKKMVGPGDVGGKPAASTAEVAPASASAVHYTSDGNDAGRATVVNVGFSIGAVIEPKKTKEDQDIQYAIKYINDDGSVGAQRIMPSGGEDKEMTIIGIDNLVNHYRQAAKRITLHEGYPDNAAIESDELQNMVVRGVVGLAMKRMHADGEYTTVKFRAQKSPKERLFALSAADKKCLRVVPITHRFGTVPSTDALDVVVVDGERYLLQRNVSKGCCSEFFVMRTVHERKDANMELKTFKETVEGIDVKVPCAVNFKDVKANDEVVLFKPAPPKAAPKAKPVMAVLEPPSKKSKTA